MPKKPRQFAQPQKVKPVVQASTPAVGEEKEFEEKSGRSMMPPKQLFVADPNDEAPEQKNAPALHMPSSPTVQRSESLTGGNLSEDPLQLSILEAGKDYVKDVWNGGKRAVSHLDGSGETWQEDKELAMAVVDMVQNLWKFREALYISIRYFVENHFDEIVARVPGIAKDMIEGHQAKKLVNIIAGEIAEKFIVRITSSTLFKQLGARVASMAVPYAGWVLGPLSMYGMFEKINAGANRLQATYPMLYELLAPLDLHYTWVFIEPLLEDLLTDIGNGILNGQGNE